MHLIQEQITTDQRIFLCRQEQVEKSLQPVKKVPFNFSVARIFFPDAGVLVAEQETEKIL